VFSALTYPGVMISVSFAVITYLFVSVVPKLQKVFASLKATLPWYTQLLIDISNFIQNNWLLLLISAVTVGVLFEKWLKTPEGRRKFDRFSLKVPVFGGIFLALNVSRFTRTLSTLMDSGVQIVPALEITKNIIGNVIISEVIEQAKIAVQEGKSLGLTLEKSGEFPPIVSHMVKTGEKTGSVETMLNHVAIAYDAEVERKIGSMVSLIEPAMIVVMGGIVVVVVIAMMVPMLGLMSQVR
jgi:general secretion pathway protein F